MCTQNTAYLRSGRVGLFCDCIFDRGNRTYSPGDEVTGKIQFIPTGREPLQGLKVRLVGVEEIQAESDFPTYSRIFLSLECYAPLVLEENTDTDGCFYPFYFSLATSGLPQTFFSEWVNISYYVETCLGDRASLALQSTDGDWRYLGREYFRLIPSLDLNFLPEAQGPLFLIKDNSGGLRALFQRNRNTLRLTLQLHKKGFVPLENIHFTLDVINRSTKSVQRTHIKLIQELKFSMSSVSRSSSQTLCKVVGPSIGPNTTQTWENVLKVPAEIPVTTHAHYISIAYKLRVTLVTSVWIENVKGEVGIVIGTIPIDDFGFLEPQAMRSNSFTSSTTNTLSPRGRTRHHTPFRNIDLSYRHSISSLPTYTSVERHDQETEPAPPSYEEATSSE